MGSIRLEPKEETTDKEEYRKLKTAIVDAWAAIDEHRVFWDLEEDENPSRIKRAFLEVAREEKIPLEVRRIRGERTLELSFDTGSGKALRSGDRRRDRSDDAQGHRRPGQDQPLRLEQADQRSRRRGCRGQTRSPPGQLLPSALLIDPRPRRAGNIEGIEDSATSG